MDAIKTCSIFVLSIKNTPKGTTTTTMLKEPVASLVKNTHDKTDVINTITSIYYWGTSKTALNKCCTYISHLRKHGKVAGLADFAYQVYLEAYVHQCNGGCQDELRERLTAELDNYEWS